MFFSSQDIDKSLPSLRVTFGKWSKAVYMKSYAEIRRLSTRSSVLVNKDDIAGLTEWKWYWKNTSNWDEYSIWVRI